MTDLEALRRDLELLWVRDGRGRIVRARTPEDRGPPPLLVVAAPPDGVGRVWAASAAVDDDVVVGIGAAIDGEPATTTPLAPDRPWTPDAAARILDLLGGHGAIEVETSYVLDGAPAAAAPPAGVTIRTSAEDGAEAVRAQVPAPDRELGPPWAVAIVDGEVAAVCESARLLSTAAAAGVWTYEPHRRRGLATAVVATWAGMVEGTPHYGHDRANVASAGVARRVGFRPIGAWWWVRP